jgi:hypothetical protein
MAIAISWPMKYAYHLLERTALGHFEPPPMTLELVNPFSQQPLKHLAILLALAWLCYRLQDAFGPAAAGVALFAGLLLQPACAVAIALEGSLLRALDPRTLGVMVRVLGRDYLVIAAAVFLVGLFAFVTAGRLPRGIWYALVLYSVFGAFHLIGLAIYRHREALGLEANVSPEREHHDTFRMRREQLNRLLDEVYHLANGDWTQSAINTLLHGLEGGNAGLDDHAYVHEQTFDWPSPAVALRHAQVHITRLMRDERLPDAVDVYARCMRRSNEFRVEGAEQVLPLARCAETLHMEMIAVHILRNFESRFPDHPDCGAVRHLRERLSAAL